MTADIIVENSLGTVIEGCSGANMRLVLDRDYATLVSATDFGAGTPTSPPHVSLPLAGVACLVSTGAAAGTCDERLAIALAVTWGVLCAPARLPAGSRPWGAGPQGPPGPAAGLTLWNLFASLAPGGKLALPPAAYGPSVNVIAVKALGSAPAGAERFGWWLEPFSPAVVSPTGLYAAMQVRARAVLRSPTTRPVMRFGQTAAKSRHYRSRSTPLAPAPPHTFSRHRRHGALPCPRRRRIPRSAPLLLSKAVVSSRKPCSGRCCQVGEMGR